MIDFRAGKVTLVLAGILVLSTIGGDAIRAQSQAPPRERPEIERFNQVPTGMGLSWGPNSSLMYPVRFPEVQADLKMTEAQKKKFADIDLKSARAEKQYRSAFDQRVKQLPEDADINSKMALMQEYKAQQAQQRKDDDRELRKTLDRGQLTRLQQINLQLEGPHLFKRPDIQEKLLLEEYDVDKILAIILEGDRARQRESVIPTSLIETEKARAATKKEKGRFASSKAFKEGLKSFEKKVANIRSDTMERILKVLTKGRRARYEKLIGQPFDFSKTWGKPIPFPPVIPDEPVAKESEPPTRK